MGQDVVALRNYSSRVMACLFLIEGMAPGAIFDFYM